MGKAELMYIIKVVCQLATEIPLSTPNGNFTARLDYRKVYKLNEICTYKVVFITKVEDALSIALARDL